MNTSQPSTPRNALRRILMAQRCTLSPSHRQWASEQLAIRLAQWCAAHTNARDVVAVYCAHQYEPDLLPWAHLINRPLALPVMQAPNAPLVFARWAKGDALVPDRYGIGVPKTQTLVNVNLIVMPCVGLMLSPQIVGSTAAQRIYRMGYGGGYYDRTIAMLRNSGSAGSVQTLGLAYASARCVFEPNEHDACLDDYLIA